MAKKDRMKNGLDSLFEDNLTESGVAEAIRISLIEPDREQPRQDFDEESLAQLADNIGKYGVLQPILVREIGDNRYKIVAGERRWRAARLAGLTEIPAIVRELSEDEAAEIALIENIQREDLSPIEEANAYSRLAVDFLLTQDEIAARVGKSRAAVANTMRLLKLSNYVKAALNDGKLSVGHAKILCGIDDESVQKELADKIISEDLTVRELERLTARSARTDGKKSKKPKNEGFGSENYAYVVEVKDSFKNRYGIEPKLKIKTDGSVDLQLKFKDKNEFNDFLNSLS